MAVPNLPPIDLDSSSTYQYMVYDPTTRRAAISETTKYSGTGTFIVPDGIPYRDAVNTLRQPQTYTPVWFGNADYTAAGVSSIVLGDRGGGAVTTGANSVAITPNGGPMNQAGSAIAIGNGAGRTNQGAEGVAIGFNAGQDGQLLNSIAIGTGAGLTNQDSYCVAIGSYAGGSSQRRCAIAIGSGVAISSGETLGGAGYENQGIRAIAIGPSAGRTNQGDYCIAIGQGAGQDGQLPNSIAIGSSAGLTNQQGLCIAIGFLAGNTNQQKHAIAIGNYEAGVAFAPGLENQGYGSIAIGSGAGGRSDQGAYSICIGYNAGSNVNLPVPANTIVIDAMGPTLDSGIVPPAPGTCLIRPIRNIANTDPSLRMHYEPGLIELSWGVEASSARFKTNVTNLSESCVAATLNDLKPVEFDFVDTGRHSIGFIAEDVHRVLPEIAIKNPLTGAVEGIEYDKLVAPLVRLAQDRQRELDILQTSYEALQTSSKALQTSYETMQTSYEILRSEYETNRNAVETLRMEFDELKSNNGWKTVYAT